MTPAELQRRYEARRIAKYKATLPQWVKELPTLDAPRMDMTGVPTREELLAGITDPALRAEVAAQFDADEAALERAERGELDDEEGE